jgi:WD40 repeat protein
MKRTLLGFLCLAGLCFAQPAPRLVVPVPHSLAITALSQSPDGRYLASGDVRGTLKVWDQTSNRLQQTLTSQRGGFVPYWLDWLDACKLVCYGSDFRYHTYDIASGVQIASQPAQAYRSQGGVVQARGRIYLCPMQKGAPVLECWEPTAWKKLSSWPIPSAQSGDTVSSLSVTPDGAKACLLLSGGRALEVNLERGQPSWQWNQLPDNLHLAGYGPDGVTVAAYGPTGVYWLGPQPPRGPLGSPARSALWVEGKVQILSDNRLFQLDPESPQVVTLNPQPSPISLSQAVSNRHLVLGTADGQLLDAQNGQPLFAQPSFNEIRRLAYDPQGNLYAGLVSGQVVCWSLRSGKRETVFPGSGRVVGMALSANGRVLAVSRAQDANLEFYDCANLKSLTRLTMTEGGLASLQCSHDGRYVAGLRGRQLEIYDRQTGKLLEKRALAQDLAYAFHPTAPVLAVAGRGEVIETDLSNSRQVNYPNYRASALAYDNQGKLYGFLQWRPDRLRLEPIVVRSPKDLAFSQGGQDYPWSGGHREAWSLGFDPFARTWLLGTNQGGIFRLGQQGEIKPVLPDGGSLALDQPNPLPNGTFITLGREHTVEFWKASEDSPRGQLLVLNQGADWLVTERSGLFDGTPEAERQVEWVLDNHKVRVDQLFEKAYRPGLLKSFGTSGSEVRPASPTGLQIRPPQVEVLEPAAGAQVAQRIVDVRVTVKDQGGGASEPRLFVNGHALPHKPRQSDGEYLFQAPLQPGVNEIRCTAMDKTGSVESRGNPLRLTCTLPVQRKPKLMVIAVGLNQAGNATRLSFAEKDARSLSESLKSPLFESCDVRLLAGEQARTDLLQKSFEELGKEAQPQDTLVLFLAGHGVVDSKGYHFLMSAGQPSLDGASLTQWLREFPAQKQFVILDTCHAGAVSDELAASFAISQQRMARGSGVYLLAACRSEQSALELPRLQHGLLTYSLLEGLKSAPANSRQQLTVSGLVYFVCSQVPDLCRQVGLNQDVFQFVSGTDFPLRLTTGR